MSPDILNKMAQSNGWEFVCIQENISMISFSKTIDGESARINIYMTKMTVSTSLTHPTKGKTQLFRKCVNPSLMKKILKNPRVHTPNGYRTKC